MNRKPINPDDPQLSAYALGELSMAETAEFELGLMDSPIAQAELASMREVMSLLSCSLRKEWEDEVNRPAFKLLEPFKGEKAGGEEDRKLVTVEFGHSKRYFAAAAAVIALLFAVSFFQENRESAERMLADSSSPVGVHVPRLFLADEIDDISTLDLAEEDAGQSSIIDATYLDASQVIPASFVPKSAVLRASTPGRFQEIDRVDSYLPSVETANSNGGTTTGMIESRLSHESSSVSLDRSGSVFVRGYVTMDGNEMGALHGFRPVSISGNPVKDEEAELRLLANLNGLQRDLTKLLKEMPEGSPEKVKLERILEKNGGVVSQLRANLAQ